MKKTLIPLNLLPIGRHGRVNRLIANGSVKRRLLDMGFTNGTRVEVLQQSPSGDPIAYQVRGAVIALRSEESSLIIMEALLQEG